MKTEKLHIGLLLVAGALSLVACNVQEPAVPVPTGPAADAAPTEPSADVAPAPAAKVDPASAEALEAGLAAMTPRLLSQTDAYSKIEPKAFRLFMHPDQGKNAVVEFDTKGLESVTLSPYVYDFNGDASCESNTEAGVVDLVWSVDDGAPTTVRVDRHYAELLPISLANTSKLKIEVNEGNGAPWCDWAGIGFVEPKP